MAEMTLDEAVRVLNERGHRWAKDWFTHRPYPGRPDTKVSSRGAHFTFDEFEAVAVAEKLERKAGPGPATRVILEALYVVGGDVFLHELSEEEVRAALAENGMEGS